MLCDRCDNTGRPRGTQALPALAAALLFLAPLQPFTASAEAQSIRGIVVEAAGRAPIAGAIVELRGDHAQERTQATSDSLGRFVLAVPRAGTYTLRVRHLAYLTHEADTLRIGTAESVSIEIRLDPTVISLEPLVVTARGSGWLDGFEARRHAGGFGRFLTRKDIDARAAPRTTDLLRAIPGVIITPQRRGPGSLIQMRGSSGLCQPAIWLDGHFAAQSAGGTTLDDLLSPAVIEAVEIYNSVSSAPIQYRTGSCGVVLFWTRRGSSGDGQRLSWKKAVIGLGAAVVFVLLIR